jgi:hypothetical protein
MQKYRFHSWQNKGNAYKYCYKCRFGSTAVAIYKTLIMNPLYRANAYLQEAAGRNVILTEAVTD